MANIINKIKNYKPAILDRYVLTQVVIATLICLVLFIIIWIAPETLFKIVKKMIRHTITVSWGIKILILEIPKILSKAIPVSILLGSIFTFDRLSKNSELAIMRSIGLSFNRIMERLEEVTDEQNDIKPCCGNFLEYDGNRCR